MKQKQRNKKETRGEKRMRDQEENRKDTRGEETD